MPRVKQFDEEEAIKKLTEVFWRKGYANCSIGDLVESSGLSRSSLYDTFGDKEQLFIRCLEYYTEGTKQGLEKATKDKKTSLEQIEAVLRMPFDLPDAKTCKGCFAVNTMGELKGDPCEVQQLILNTKSVWEDLLAKLIEQGKSSHEITRSDSPKSLATFIYTALCGLIVLQKAMPDKAEISRQIAQILSILKS